MSDFVVGSDNVFADLGLPDAERHLRKADLVAQMRKIVDERGWTQLRAAREVGMTQPRLSKMFRGHFEGISEEKMLDALTRLGCRVEIVISKPAERPKRGCIALSLPA